MQDRSDEVQLLPQLLELLRGAATMQRATAPHTCPGIITAAHLQRSGEIQRGSLRQGDRPHSRGALAFGDANGDRPSVNEIYVRDLQTAGFANSQTRVAQKREQELEHRRGPLFTSEFYHVVDLN